MPYEDNSFCCYQYMFFTRVVRNHVLQSRAGDASFIKVERLNDSLVAQYHYDRKDYYAKDESNARPLYYL